MALALSPLFTGSPPPPPVSLHLLSTVTMASASADSDMDTPFGDESPPSDPPPPPPSSLPSPPPPQSKPLSAPSAPPSRPMPVREDCWSEEATATLIEAWGDRYVELNKGNLRQKHWQEVADAVNAAHGHTKKTRRTDIQCKNRIDTIKKKYKIEKAKTVESSGAYVSPWPFFSRLDSLIGDSTVKKFSTSTPSPAATGSADLLRRKPAARSSSPCRALALTPPFPVGPRSMKPKRPAAMDDSFFRRTFAAAAAAASESEDEDGENERDEPETSRSSGAGSRRRGWRKEGCGGGSSGSDGCRQLAEAIVRFGEIYERVEGMKQEQMIELEKHRMQFAKELEFQRMKLLMDTQLQLAKIKRMKPSNDADADSY